MLLNFQIKWKGSYDVIVIVGDDKHWIDDFEAHDDEFNDINNDRKLMKRYTASYNSPGCIIWKNVPVFKPKFAWKLSIIFSSSVLLHYPDIHSLWNLIPKKTCHLLFKNNFQKAFWRSLTRKKVVFVICSFVEYNYLS